MIEFKEPFTHMIVRGDACLDNPVTVDGICFSVFWFCVDYESEAAIIRAYECVPDGMLSVFLEDDGIPEDLKKCLFEAVENKIDELSEEEAAYAKTNVGLVLDGELRVCNGSESN